MESTNTKRGGARAGAGRKPIPGKTHRINFRELMETAKAPQKACDYLIHLRAKSDHFEHMVVRSFCGSWACPRCNQENKTNWIEHLTYKTFFAFDEERHRNSRASILLVKTDKEWEGCVRKRLQRKHADFARVRLNNGQLVVINNGGFGDLYSGDSFASELKKIFGAVGYNRKPVSSSKRWQMGAHASTHKWERVHRLYTNLAELKKTLAEFDIQTKPIFSFHLSGLTFECPSDWGENDISNLGYELESIEGEESK
jgi:hypothetical protein